MDIPWQLIELLSLAIIDISISLSIFIAENIELKAYLVSTKVCFAMSLFSLFELVFDQLQWTQPEKLTKALIAECIIILDTSLSAMIITFARPTKLQILDSWISSAYLRRLVQPVIGRDGVALHDFSRNFVEPLDDSATKGLLTLLTIIAVALWISAELLNHYLLSFALLDNRPTSTYATCLKLYDVSCRLDEVDRALISGAKGLAEGRKRFEEERQKIIEAFRDKMRGTKGSGLAQPT